jgi:ABC-type multidrug transport system fused ATPase/permease subunit
MDRIHVFDEGSIVETGTYPELINADGPFARLFAPTCQN